MYGDGGPRAYAGGPGKLRVCVEDTQSTRPSVGVCLSTRTQRAVQAEPGLCAYNQVVGEGVVLGGKDNKSLHWGIQRCR